MQHWFITGCSTGLGRALSLAALAEGGTVTVTARRPDDVADILAEGPVGRCGVQALDVTDANQIAEAVRRAEAQFGGIDVLVNNAGFGLRAALEEAIDADIRALFEANVFGLIGLTQAVLPGMRARRSGTIVNVGSVAGRLAQAGNGLYSATKFAVEGLSDALRKEVEPLGIRVMLVEPGPFRTDFAGRSLKQAAVPIADYATTAGRLRKEHSRMHGTQPGDPVRAARCLVEALRASRPPFRLVLGQQAATRIEAELEAQSQELERWRFLGDRADFPNGTA